MTVVNANALKRRQMDLEKVIWNPMGITDPLYKDQWHLENRLHENRDINVTGVWMQGITGTGVTVAIVDDGLDFESNDLRANFNAEASYDFNNHTALPKPLKTDDFHGTRCAGEIAAVRDNDVCGVGVAFNAKVSGIRILSEDIDNADEAAALNYHYHENLIFSCSWGPPDDGVAVEAPEGIIAKAFVNGVLFGRRGLGTIYVFASGNGGAKQDNCNFDGYTNSVYTLTIGAIDEVDGHPLYSEACSALMAVTYSSGSAQERHIYTTDVSKKGVDRCTNMHGGTSAAAPLAAGILALVLSARPNLNWRDIQHLCYHTAIPVSLDDPDWQRTYTKKIFNHKFGYGRLDTYQLVRLARSWVSVNPQISLNFPLVPVNETIPDGNEGLASVTTVTQEDLDSVDMDVLEHVTVTVDFEHAQRGDLEYTLESPHGIISRLADRRPNDASDLGLKHWMFMTVKHWQEPPAGNWTFRVYDKVNEQKRGTLISWSLTLYGANRTEQPPPPSPFPSTIIQANIPTPTLSSAYLFLITAIIACCLSFGAWFVFRCARNHRTFGTDTYGFELLDRQGDVELPAESEELFNAFDAFADEELNAEERILDRRDLFAIGDGNIEQH